MFALLGAGYLALLLLYSAWLKHVVIIDVLTIAAGFVLRAVAGAVAVNVPIGPWLPVCTTLLALFLVLSKRRHELILLGEGATTHRPILEEYTPLPSRPDDCGRHGVHADRLQRVLHQRRNRRAAWAPHGSG